MGANDDRLRAEAQYQEDMKAHGLSATLLFDNKCSHDPNDPKGRGRSGGGLSAPSGGLGGGGTPTPKPGPGGGGGPGGGEGRPSGSGLVEGGAGEDHFLELSFTPTDPPAGRGKCRVRVHFKGQAETTSGIAKKLAKAINDSPCASGHGYVSMSSDPERPVFARIDLFNAKDIDFGSSWPSMDTYYVENLPGGTPTRPPGENPMPPAEPPNPFSAGEAPTPPPPGRKREKKREAPKEVPKRKRLNINSDWTGPYEQIVPCLVLSIGTVSFSRTAMGTGIEEGELAVHQTTVAVPVPRGKANLDTDVAQLLRASGWRVSIDDRDGLIISGAPGGGALVALFLKTTNPPVSNLAIHLDIVDMGARAEGHGGAGTIQMSGLEWALARAYYERILVAFGCEVPTIPVPLNDHHGGTPRTLMPVTRVGNARQVPRIGMQPMYGDESRSASWREESMGPRRGPES